MIKISVIIPCYNGWKYMSRCLESLENQTLSPYEIIIADDCSTDDSYRRVEEYARLSSLNIVHIINSDNKGPGITRENAYKVSTGDYIAFCDCDDWYEFEFIEKVTSIIEKAVPDLVIFDNYITHDAAKAVAHTVTPLVGKSKEYILANYPMSLCRMIVKRSLFDNIVFPPLYNGEDGAVAPQIITNAEKIEILDEPIYNYYFREGSASNKPSCTAYLNMIEAFRTVELIRERYPSECEFLGIKIVCYGATLNAFKVGVSDKEIRSMMNDYTQEYPLWHKNAYYAEYSKIKKLYLGLIRAHMYVLARIMAKLHYSLTKKKR